MNLIIQPNENFKLAGTTIQLDKTKQYRAVKASNQPYCDELRKIFVGDILLQKGDYKIIKFCRMGV